MVNKVLLPRAKRHSITSRADLFHMEALDAYTTINLPGLMIKHMNKVADFKDGKSWAALRNAANEDIRRLKARNSILESIAWIRNTVAPNLISTVIYASDAYTVWENLRERFEKLNASRAAYLYKEIATLTQEVSSVVYFSHLRELWDEYETLTPPPSCGCLASQKHIEHHQLLTGLNDTYKNAKNQCEYCKCKGHTKENCFKLHGYPSDFKNKRRGGTFNAQANNVNNNMNHMENNYGNLPSDTQGNQLNYAAPDRFFTPEQYQQILQMLNKGKDTKPIANLATTWTSSILHAFMSTLVDHNWIVDTGASNHMVHSLNLLDSYKEVSEKDKNKVQLPTGEQASITHIGICSFFINKKSQNILHIADFKYNLLSEIFSGKVLGIGREELGLFILKAAERRTPEHHISPSLMLHHKSEKGDKFSPRTIPAVHMGYSSSQKSYILYDLHSKGFFVSRDIVFKEDIFPFKHMQLGTSPLFPILEFANASIKKSASQPVSISDLLAFDAQQMSSPSSPLYGGNSEPTPPLFLLLHPQSLMKGFSCCILAIVEPRTFKEASADPKWIKAMQAEISTLQDNNTCVNSDVERYKARLVAKGYSQQEGLDYTDTFSHVAKMVTGRAVVALAAASGW
ncbi:uncharacterized protein LOC142162679 [Nicotiana tabacum]|uniref:Uncharacterized protein LOC142162679 n=1 Tax=Nicotiana tabacum TaxID=4097 RepID=A0AC58RRD9_TOBAC